MHVYLNGRMVPVHEACVSVEDAGFQHAVGLFETMCAGHGRVFRLDAHLRRLEKSAVELGLTRHLDRSALQRAVETTLVHNELTRARVRLTVTAGPVSLLRRGSAEDDDDNGRGRRAETPPLTVLVTATEPIEYEPAYFEQGITVLIAPPAANPFDPMAGHKTLAYWSRLRTLRQAASAGAGEAIWLNVSNHLAGGAVSNLFLVKDGQLFTPFARGEEVAGALAAPVLPGVTRATIIELAEAQDLPVHRRMLSVTDLLEADEAFLTNSSWQALPVTRVEKRPIGSGRVGPVTQQLRRRLLALIERETSR